MLFTNKFCIKRYILYLLKEVLLHKLPETKEIAKIAISENSSLPLMKNSNNVPGWQC